MAEKNLRNAIICVVSSIILLGWWALGGRGGGNDIATGGIVVLTHPPSVAMSSENTAELNRLRQENEDLKTKLTTLTEQCAGGQSKGQSSVQLDHGPDTSMSGPHLFIPYGPKNTFRKIATALKDDKAWRHRYDVAYSNYLERIRDKPLRVLEIGLGCDQPIIGLSVLLWEQYLPNAKLTMIEYDEKCTKDWSHANAGRGPKGGIKFFSGDQANRQFLRRVVNEDVGPSGLYDVIIDDGGHHMHQQITSFEELWPKLRSGGIYVVEDLNTSYKTHYGGSRRPAETKNVTMMKVLQEKLDHLHAVPVKNHPGKLLEDKEFHSPYHRIDCYHFICILTKK
eukprot:PhF_6_TR33811/c0_g1_i1/m.49585